MPDLRRLLEPQVIAVVGASADPSRVSGKPIKYLLKHGYTGTIVPVNPGRESILGVPTVKSVAEIPRDTDLAVLARGSEHVLADLSACGERGVGFAMLIASGFAEIGAEGERLQEEVQEVARRFGIRLLGPNCQSVINIPGRVACGFGRVLELPSLRQGPISVVTQSGGWGLAAVGAGMTAGLGFHHVINTGNEADIDIVEALAYEVAEPSTRVIAVYAERIRRWDAFREAVLAANEAGKTVVMWKAGQSVAGGRAAASHTASLTGSGQVARDLLSEIGVIPVTDLQDFVDVAGVTAPGRELRGDRVAVVTGSGGFGVLMADRLSERGLQVPEPSAEVQTTLRGIVPSFGAVTNPIDLTAATVNDESVRTRALATLGSAGEFDALVIVNGNTAGTAAVALAQELVELNERLEIFICVVWSAPEEIVEGAYAILRDAHIPLFSSPGPCAEALARLARHVEASRLLGSAAPFEEIPAHADHPVVPEPEGLLSGHAAQKALASYAVRFPKSVLSRTMEEAASAAAEMPGGVVLKVASPDLAHKTEVGGVELCRTLDLVPDAYRRIRANVSEKAPQAVVEGIYVEELVDGVVEFAVSGIVDPEFGPIVMIGFGGVRIELDPDVVFLPPDSTIPFLRAGLDRLRGRAILDGFRDLPRIDPTPLLELARSVGHAMLGIDGVRSIELNPVILDREGEAYAADALVEIRR